MPRVLTVLPNLRRGGAETLVVETACALTRTRRAQVEIALLQGDNAYSDQLERAGVTVHDLGLRHRYDVAGVPRLVALVRARSINLLHAHLLPAVIPAVFARRRSNVPVLVTEHSVWNRRRRIRPLRYFERWLYAQVDCVLCVSTAVREALVAWLPEAGRRSEVVHNGVPVRDIGVRAEPLYDVIFVGNMERQAKGADVLLRALATCGDLLQRACFVGAGRLKSDLERLRDALGLARKVEFVGSSDRVGALLEASRVFVLPSRWEGLPIALLEAMERGLPVVASRVGGIPEVVEDEVSGLLVPPEDVSILGRVVRQLLGSPDLQGRLGCAGRRRVEQLFSLDRHVQTLWARYERAVRQGSVLRAANWP